MLPTLVKQYFKDVDEELNSNPILFGEFRRSLYAPARGDTGFDQVQFVFSHVQLLYNAVIQINKSRSNITI